MMDIETIESAVFTRYGVSPEELRSDSRSQNLVEARWFIWYFVCKKYKLSSYARMAHRYHRARITALQGVQKLCNFIKVMPSMGQKSREIASVLKEKEKAG